MTKDSEKNSEEEAQKRFMQSLRAAVNTPPKPLKSMTRKRGSVKAKKRQTKAG